MQIHELNEYPLNPSDGDWLIVDTGKDTAKVNGGRFAYKTDMDVMQKEIANVITNNNGYKIDTLWTGTMSTGGDSATLSSPLSNYDYIDIYTYFYGDSQVYTTGATEGNLFIRNQNISDDTSSNFIVTGELKLVLSAQAVGLEFNHRWRWSGSSSASASMASNDSEMRITKIVGRKCVVNQTNTEVEDIRVGADGTVYNSAGEAVRDQVGDLDTRLSRYETIFTADVDQSVSNWLDEHPEATTTVQDGAVTEPKLASSLKNKLILKSNLALGANKPEMKCVFAELTHTETDANENVSYFGLNRLAGESYYRTYIALQGGCYNSDTGHFVIALVDASFINGILVELDVNYDVVMRSQPLAIGHANAITYNSNTKKIYIATGSTGENAGNIVIVNGASLTLDSVKDMGHVSWFVAYDQENDVYYDVDNSGNLNKYNNQFALISSVQMNQDYEGDGSIGANGLFVYNGECYYLGYIRDALDVEYLGVFINTFDENGNVKSLGTYTLSTNTDEPENVCIVGNVGYVFSGQTWLRVYKLFVDPLSIAPPNTEYFGRGDFIPSNSDLNDYTINGKYACSSSVRAATLANVPYKGPGFTLYVTNLTWFNVRQEIAYNTGEKYERVFDAVNATWTNWKKVILVGDVNNGSKTTSVSNSSSTVVDTITVPIGKIAFISAIAEFPNNATGRRMLSINDVWVSSANAVSDDTTRLSGSMIVDNRGGSAVKYVNIRAYQSSGAAMNVTAKSNYILV